VKTVLITGQLDCQLHPIYCAQENLNIRGKNFQKKIRNNSEKTAYQSWGGLAIMGINFNVFFCIFSQNNMQYSKKNVISMFPILPSNAETSSK